MTAGDQSSSPSSAVTVVLFVVRFVLDDLLHNLLHISNLNQDIFGLQISVNDATLPVQIVQAKQDLLGNLLDQRHGNTTMVPSLNQAKQVFSQYFKDHANVCAVRALVLERIEEANDMLSARMIGFRSYDAIEELDLIDGGLGVMSGRADNFQRHMLTAVVVPGKPDCREMAPAQLADDCVLSILELFANLDGVVTALAVILGIFFVGGVLGRIVYR